MLERRLSMRLGDTDNLVKLESDHRKTRRASITEQFVLPLAKTRHKERLLQMRHHLFLMQPDNVAAVHAIVHTVRLLAEKDALSLGHSLSPMDKHRFHAWADEVQEIITNASFEPSDLPTKDPILQLMEKLQALHDSHVCLAEVAVDGRQLVEKWERCGVFDNDGDSSSSSSDEEEEDSKDGGSRRHRRSLVASLPVSLLQRETAKRAKVTASYAYQRIRERAAAHVIKRNTLTWVRSRAAFVSRVEELEVFGKTTASLMDELTTLSPLQQQQKRATLTANTNDFFDMIKTSDAGGPGGLGGRLSVVATQGHCYQMVNFKELMHFSKHLALFTVDHALRRVQELEIKRKLYELRCVVKLQTWWRKTHEVVKGRRMMKLLEEVKKRQDDKQDDVRREREAAAAQVTKMKKDAKAKKQPPGSSSRGLNAASSGGVSSTGDSSGGGLGSSRKIVTKAASGSKSKELRGGGSSRGAGHRESKAFLQPTPPSTPKASASGGGHRPSMAQSKPGGAKRQLTSGATQQSLLGNPAAAEAAKEAKAASIKATAQEKAERIARVARAREAKLRKDFEDELQRRKREDEDAAEDTEDVEAAWKSFLDSSTLALAVVVDGGCGAAPPEEDIRGVEGAEILLLHQQEDQDGDLPEAKAIEEPPGGGDAWDAWSDDGDETHSTLHSTAPSSRRSTPHGSSRTVATQPPVSPMRVIVKVRRVSVRRNPSPMTDMSTTGSSSTCSSITIDTAAPSKPTTPAGAPVTPSRRQLLLMQQQEATQTPRKTVRGAGRLSVMMPFGDETPPTPQDQDDDDEGEQLTTRLSTIATTHGASTRRHLHEMEYAPPQQAIASGSGRSAGGSGRGSGWSSFANTDLFVLDQPPLLLSLGQAPELSIVDAVVTRPVSPVRMFASLRASRVARMRAALHRKRKQNQSGESREDGDPEEEDSDDSDGEDRDQEEGQDGDVRAQEPAEGSGPPTTYKPVEKPRTDWVLNNTKAVGRPVRGRASVVAAYIRNPVLRLDFRKEDVMRKPTMLAATADPTAGISSQDAPASTASTISGGTHPVVKKAKFGSHTEWLESMGLKASPPKVASSLYRGTSPPPAKGGVALSHHTAKSVAMRGAQDARRVAAAVETNVANRVRRKRKDDHALPLLGKQRRQQQQQEKEYPRALAMDTKDVEVLPRVRGEVGSRSETTKETLVLMNHGQEMMTAGGDTGADDVRHEDQSEQSGDEQWTTSSDEEDEEAEREEQPVKSTPTSKGLVELGGDRSDVQEREEGEDDELVKLGEGGEGEGGGGATGEGSEPHKESRPPSKSRRAKLHEPQHVPENKPPVRRRKRQGDPKTKKKPKTTSKDPSSQRPLVASNGDGEEQEETTSGGASVAKPERVYRPRGPSLLQRLVPRATSDTRQQSDLVKEREQNASEESVDEELDSDESSAAVELDDPARTAAFQRLFGQYMGLLNAAPCFDT